jgi:hypothetical protein
MLVLHRIAAPLVLLALAVTSVGCGGGGVDFTTPEASFQTLRMAAHHEDTALVCESLTPESQEMIVGGLVAMALGVRVQSGMAPDDAKLKEEWAAYEPVLAKHGLAEEAVQTLTPRLIFLSGPEGFPAFADDVTDKVGFMADMYDAMQTVGEVSFGEEFYEQLAGELQDVKIDGDRATAVVVTKSGESPLEFHRTATGWKLHINTDALAPATPPA